MNPGPRYLLMVFALAGLSTTTTFIWRGPWEAERRTAASGIERGKWAWA